LSLLAAELNCFLIAATGRKEKMEKITIAGEPSLLDINEQAKIPTLMRWGQSRKKVGV